MTNEIKDLPAWFVSYLRPHRTWPVATGWTGVLTHRTQAGMLQGAQQAAIADTMRTCLFFLLLSLLSAPLSAQRTHLRTIFDAPNDGINPFAGLPDPTPIPPAMDIERVDLYDNPQASALDFEVTLAGPTQGMETVGITIHFYDPDKPLVDTLAMGWLLIYTSNHAFNIAASTNGVITPRAAFVDEQSHEWIEYQTPPHSAIGGGLTVGARIPLAELPPDLSNVRFGVSASISVTVDLAGFDGMLFPDTPLSMGPEADFSVHTADLEREVGTPVTYFAEVHNTGQQTLTNSRIVDHINPSAFAYLENNRGCGDPVAASPEQDAILLLECNLGDIPPGASEIVEITLIPVAFDPNLSQTARERWILNSARFSSDQGDHTASQAIILMTTESLFMAGFFNKVDEPSAKRLSNPIDLYVDYNRIADDLAPGMLTLPAPINLSRTLVEVSVGPAGDIGLMNPINTDLFELLVPDEGMLAMSRRSLVLAVSDEHSQFSLLSQPHLHEFARDPGRIEMFFANLLSGPIAVDRLADIYADPLAPLVNGHSFSETIDMYPGELLVRVRTLDGSVDPRYFRIPDTHPGMVYFGIIQLVNDGPSQRFALRVFNTHGDPVGVEIDTASESDYPEDHIGTTLESFPNPFSDRTTVQFRSPTGLDFHLDVFDMMGRRVRTLASGRGMGQLQEGLWDGRDAAGSPVPAGLYWMRLHAGAEEVFRTSAVIR